jgi:hypothetical protein
MHRDPSTHNPTISLSGRSNLVRRYLYINILTMLGEPGGQLTAVNRYLYMRKPDCPKTPISRPKEKRGDRGGGSPPTTT